MKTRTWLLIFASVALVCTAALLVPHKAAKTAEVRSDGKVLYTLDLSKDGEYRVEHGEDWNLLIVENGKPALWREDPGRAVYPGVQGGVRAERTGQHF